jgi:hypothetical protein
LPVNTHASTKIPSAITTVRPMIRSAITT